jgi:hypothetical protein
MKKGGLFIMVQLTFAELEQFIAEISLIVIALVLIVLVTVFPNSSTISLFNDVIFLIIGAVVGLVSGKEAVRREIKEEDEVA